MTLDDATTLVRQEISPAPGATTTEGLTIVSWDDRRHARQRVARGVLEAAHSLAETDLARLLSTLAGGDANAVAAIAAFLLDRDAETQAQRWFELAQNESLRELALATWLRAMATTWRRAPESSRLAELVSRVELNTDASAVGARWWRMLSLAPRLEHVARDASFVLALYELLAQKIGSSGSIVDYDELQRYRLTNDNIASVIPYAAPHMDPALACAAHDLFWRQLREDVARDLEIGLSSVGDQLYLEAAGVAIRHDSTRWQKLVTDALTGGGLWKPAISHAQEDNAAWLLSAACIAVIGEHRDTTHVPADLLESIWATASTHLATLFWDPIAHSDVRRALAGLLAGAHALDPSTAPRRVIALAQEVSDGTFLDAIIERTTGLLDATTTADLTALRAERAQYEASLADDDPDLATE